MEDSTRNLDYILEHSVSKFMDKYFYSKLGVDFERVTDNDRQFKGIDVVLNGKNIDEKVKVKGGFISKVLEYPSFEITTLSLNTGKVTEGWFIKEDMETDYYAFITVFSNVEDWTEIVFDSIDKLMVLFVNRESVKNFVGMDRRRLGLESIKIRQNRETDTLRYPDKDFHFKISRQFPENPVNIVISRDILRGLPHSREVIVTRKKWFGAI